MCKKFYNEKIRSTWDEGPNSSGEIAARDAAAAAEARNKAAEEAARVAEEEAKKREQETQDRILAEAKENDRRRGRRATVISGVVGDPNYGSSIKTTSAYSLGTQSTRLGG